MATRREFLGSIGAVSVLNALGAGAPTPAVARSWSRGELAHLIPTASHERFLIKASFVAPLRVTPQLAIADRLVPGNRSDGQGRFWQFDVDHLTPDTEYMLRIDDAAGEPLCDPWPLKTFPAPGAPVKALRILAYTCGGGYDGVKLGDKTLFLDMDARRRLLARGLSFEPDVVISNGDMIYWDIQTALNKAAPLVDAVKTAWEKFGTLDFARPMGGGENQAILTRIGDDQIARLYGTSLRSIPSFFLTDDHDLFENDEATETLVTLPPDSGRIEAERVIQSMCYPEFLPEANRSPRLPGSSAADRRPGLSEGFGTLRYGRLLEAVLYDTKRYATIAGPDAAMVPPSAERWLLERTAAEDTLHFLHVPSTPFGWTAGKFGEWYPDVLGADGTLGTDAAKPFWPAGWWEQHQRLVSALGSQRRRVPVVVQGDLHAVGYGILRRSGTVDLGANPIHMALTGPLGTGDLGFPSAYRGAKPAPSSRLAVDELMQPIETNGFAIIDVTSHELLFRLFAWRPPRPATDIDVLEPAYTYSLRRKS